MKNVDFRNNLVKLRKAKGLTQRQLETRSNMAPTVISHYETGDRSPELKSIISLCNALECTASDLLGI